MASIRTERVTEHLGHKNTSVELDEYGIKAPARVFWNLNMPQLYEEIARRNEGVLSNHGVILVDTGEHTGRSAKDKAIVREPGSEDKVFWGDVNKDFPQDKFDALKERMMAHAKGRELFVQDTLVGADPNYRLPIRVVSELAWHSLFARTMFISNSSETSAIRLDKCRFTPGDSDADPVQKFRTGLSRRCGPAARRGSVSRSDHRAACRATGTRTGPPGPGG